MKKTLLLFIILLLPSLAFAIDNPGISTYEPSEYSFPLISNGVPTTLRIDPDDLPGIAIAASWTLIPFMGRTQGGMAVMPYTLSPDRAELEYEFALPETTDSVKVHVVTKSTLAFSRLEGHRYAISIDGAPETIVNFNANLNEQPENIYTTFYPTVAHRVVEKIIPLNVSKSGNPMKHTLRISPLDSGIVFEKNCDRLQRI